MLLLIRCAMPESGVCLPWLARATKRKPSLPYSNVSVLSNQMSIGC